MKLKLFILITIVTLFAVASAMAMPAPAGFSFDEDNSVAFVAAVGYSQAVTASFGLAVPLSNKIYTFMSFMGGDYGGALTGKMGYLLSIDGGTYFGVLAGPEAQWQNIPEDNVDPTLYIVGATGMIFGHSYEKWGMFGMVQRVFPLEDNNITNSYSFAVGFHLNL